MKENEQVYLKAKLKKMASLLDSRKRIIKKIKFKLSRREQPQYLLNVNVTYGGLEK